VFNLKTTTAGALAEKNIIADNVFSLIGEKKSSLYWYYYSASCIVGLHNIAIYCGLGGQKCLDLFDKYLMGQTRLCVIILMRNQNELFQLFCLLSLELIVNMPMCKGINKCLHLINQYSQREGIINFSNSFPGLFFYPLF